MEIDEPVVSQPPFTRPDSPTNVTVGVATASSAMISWKAPKNDGGNKVKCYHLEKRERRRQQWIRVTTETDLVKFTTHSVKGLVEGLFYQMRVIAENDAGNSKPSLPSALFKVEAKLIEMAPVIVEPLRDSVAKPGQHLTLQCKVSGTPKPLVKWYKAGRELTASNKYDIREARGNYFSLTIKNCNGEDETEYSARAMNSSGAKHMTCKISVQVPAKINLPRRMMYEATKCHTSIYAEKNESRANTHETNKVPLPCKFTGWGNQSIH